MNSIPPDCLARVQLQTTREGGRQSPALSGYRPHHAITDEYLTSAIHEYLDTDWLFPGESSLAHVTFATPEAYPNSLWRGKVMRIQEGEKVVGTVEIIDIHNALLDGDKRDREIDA